MSDVGRIHVPFTIYLACCGVVFASTEGIVPIVFVIPGIIGACLSGAYAVSGVLLSDEWDEFRQMLSK